MFGKLANGFNFPALAVTGAGILFVVAVLFEFQVGTSGIASIFLVQVGGCLIVGIVELVSVLVFSSSQSQYVGIAFSRLGIMVAVGEIVVSVIFLIWFAFHLGGKSTSNVGFLFGGGNSPLVGLFSGALILVLVPFIFFSLEKVPFDLVEAESELIDGVTTEFEGFAFSVIYAAEVSSGFVLLKAFSFSSGYVVLWIFGLCFTAFVGRIFLTRFLFSDACEFMLTTGLFLTTTLAVVLNFHVKT